MSERRYLALIETGGNGCSACAPDLPGCVASADSREDVGREMRDAIALQVEGLLEAGEPIPEPSGLTATYV